MTKQERFRLLLELQAVEKRLEHLESRVEYGEELENRKRALTRMLIESERRV